MCDSHQVNHSLRRPSGRKPLLSGNTLLLARIRDRTMVFRMAVAGAGGIIGQEPQARPEKNSPHTH